MTIDPMKRQDELFRQQYDEMLMCEREGCGFRSERTGSWQFNPRQGYLQCPRCGGLPMSERELISGNLHRKLRETNTELNSLADRMEVLHERRRALEQLIEGRETRNAKS